MYIQTHSIDCKTQHVVVVQGRLNYPLNHKLCQVSMGINKQLKLIDVFCLPTGNVRQLLCNAEKLHASEDLERIAIDKGFIISDKS